MVSNGFKWFQDISRSFSQVRAIIFFSRLCSLIDAVTRHFELKLHVTPTAVTLHSLHVNDPTDFSWSYYFVTGKSFFGVKLNFTELAQLETPQKAVQMRGERRGKKKNFFWRKFAHSKGFVCPQKRVRKKKKKGLVWCKKYSVLYELATIIRDLFYVPLAKRVRFT